MNVSKNAYFTTEYLEERKRFPKSLRTTNVTWANSRSRLVPPRSYPTRPSPGSGNAVPDSIEPIENPDELMEEITPAELNYLTKSLPRRERLQLIDYYDYYKPRSGPRSPKKSRRALIWGDSLFFSEALVSESQLLGEALITVTQYTMPGREAFSGYYIDQKKYDRAKKVKPSLNTHKTFKEVFESDSDNRLNPIDVVFMDPFKENERGIFSKALKAVQKTIGYDDYDSYDYFAQAREVTDTMKGLSAAFDKSTGKMRISSKSITKHVLGPKGAVIEIEGSLPRDLVLEQDPLEELYNDPLSRKKYFLSKSNSPKKLSQNDHSPKEMLLRRKPPSRTVSGMTVEEQDNLEYPYQLQNRQEKGAQLGRLSKDDAIGPKDTFLPLWNSILSWVVYERLAPSEDPRINKFEQSMNNSNGGEGEHDPKGRRFNAENLINAKKYKQALQKWKDLVSDNLIAPPESLQRGRKQQSAQSDPDVEYEVGFDDDLPDELILKPRTGQLVPQIPKSSVSPRVQQAVLQVDENTPVAIISSVNKLIKNIRLMQILFVPIDIISDNFSGLQMVVIIVEFGIFLWVLYELSLIIDALCMTVKAVCAPMIAVGRFMNRIM